MSNRKKEVFLCRDVLFHILEYLDYKSLYSVSQTNQLFRKVSSYDIFWKKTLENYLLSLDETTETLLKIGHNFNYVMREMFGQIINLESTTFREMDREKLMGYINKIQVFNKNKGEMRNYFLRVVYPNFGCGDFSELLREKYLILEILEYSPYKVLMNASRANRLFYNLSCHDYLWRGFFKNHLSTLNHHETIKLKRSGIFNKTFGIENINDSRHVIPVRLTKAYTSLKSREIYKEIDDIVIHEKNSGELRKHFHHIKYYQKIDSFNFKKLVRKSKIGDYFIFGGIPLLICLIICIICIALSLRVDFEIKFFGPIFFCILLVLLDITVITKLVFTTIAYYLKYRNFKNPLRGWKMTEIPGDVYTFLLPYSLLLFVPTICFSIILPFFLKNVIHISYSASLSIVYGSGVLYVIILLVVCLFIFKHLLSLLVTSKWVTMSVIAVTVGVVIFAFFLSSICLVLFGLFLDKIIRIYFSFIIPWIAGIIYFLIMGSLRALQIRYCIMKKAVKCKLVNLTILWGDLGVAFLFLWTILICLKVDHVFGAYMKYTYINVLFVTSVFFFWLCLVYHMSMFFELDYYGYVKNSHTKFFKYYQIEFEKIVENLCTCCER